MNEGSYDNQKIVAYLLGSLPEVEAEQFDESSLTDERFADALKVSESDLIDAYLHGELAGATRLKFESHYLASAYRREKVEFARAFQLFAEKDIGKAADEKKETSEKISLWNWFKNPQRFLPFGFAAAALVILVFGIWWFANFNPNQSDAETARQNTSVPESGAASKQNEQPRPANSGANEEVAAAADDNKQPPSKPEKESTKKPSVAEVEKTPEREKSPTSPKISVAFFVLAPPLRGTSRIPEFPIAKQTTGAAVQIQLEADDFAAYRVALVNQVGQKLWQSNSLKSKNKVDNPTLNIRFSAKLLKSQNYSLVVSGINADGAAEIIGNYPFRAVIK